MNNNSHKYLYDVLDSIELIEDFLKEITIFFDYEKDLKTKSAVERHLIIIGEAVNKFEKEHNNESLLNAREIINFRNRLVHAYDSIDDAMVWAIKTNHLTLLN